MPRTFRKDLLGPARAKLQPKLQMIANGDEEVNACRAEQSAALSVRSEKLLRETPLRRQQGDAPVRASALGKLPARKKLAAVVSGIEANVFVQLTDVAEDGKTVPGALSQHGRTVRARVPLSKLPALAADPRIAFIEMGESLKAPRPRLTTGEITAPNSSKRRFGREAKHKFGADVLIGIIDVEGFDFSHPDFLDAGGKTRFVAIWDQGGNTRPTPGAIKKQFDYGAEFRQQHLNDAIKVAPKLGVAPYDVERQSQMAEGSHGTHVASVAAGNTGVCRRSPIAGVLVALANQEVSDRRRSFYDSTRIADAVDYLVDLAASMKKRLSINISLGTNGHAHDGSGAIGRYLDSIFSIPGRALTVAAGNAGQEIGETTDDIGWIMGRIHTSGRIPAANLTKEIEWEIVGNGQLDLSENELELWFSAQDKFGVSLRTPKGEWTEEILPLEFIENRRLPGGSFISIYNELHHPSNGSNHIAIYLSPNLKTDPVVGVPAGRWVVRLRGIEVRDGKFDGWIERDDPRKLGRVGEKEAWAFPSFFSQQSMVDNSTVSSLGCGNRVITVANYDEARNRINITSSQGPSRDGRTKPDIAAPGTDIAAAKGFFSGNDKWIGMSGTSMAAPYVTGVIGLMLAIEPSLTSAQIEGILRSTAKPLPGANFTWANDAGFGVIDPDACLEQAALVNSRKDRT